MFSLCCSACDYVCVEESDMKSHVSHGHTGRSSVVCSGMYCIERWLWSTSCPSVEQEDEVSLYNQLDGISFPAELGFAAVDLFQSILIPFLKRVSICSLGLMCFKALFWRKG